jgi:segregation and condensation protein B
VRDAVNALKKKYAGASGIQLVRFNDKLQLRTNPAYAAPVALVLNPQREKALTAACLETAAIVAYRQPVTKSEIEQIRGANCDYTMQVLTKFNLVTAVGRKDAVGKPFLFGTTDDFLRRFGLESIDRLPDYEALLERIAVITSGAPEQTQEGDALYNFTLMNTDEEELPAHLRDEVVERVKPE